MENHDKIYEQFKNAAKSAETKDFPDMEKVWNRVEQKLDTTVLVKQNQLWKKIAVAASVVLVVTLAFQLLKPNNNVVHGKNPVIVAADTITQVNNLPEQVAVEVPAENNAIKPNAEAILEQRLQQAEPVAVATKTEAASFTEEESQTVEKEKASDKKSAEMITRKFNATSVTHNVNSSSVPVAAQIAEKDAPLIVVDGKAQVQKSESAARDSKAAIAEIAANDLNEITVLKEPLYIINGIRYSEKELFGPNPTSPYSPLNKQEIETISILQNEKAIEIYGDSGKKGVVIITTKNGKPLAKDR